MGTALGLWLFRAVISDGRCSPVLEDVNTLISAPGYKADYFPPNYQELCLNFCFYFKETLDHQESMNVPPALIDPCQFCFSGGRKRKKSPDGDRTSEEHSNLTPLIT